MAKMKTIIIVGMHRSGTSLTASLLQESGLNIGEDLMGSAAGNDKGHFENMDFYDFHRKVLTKLALNPDGWDELELERFEAEDEAEARKIIEKNQSARWGWKDPRTTLFLRAWAKLLPEACFLFIYRSPAEVIDSLYRRATDELFVKHPEKCADVWLQYNRLILKYHKAFEDRALLVDVRSFIHAYPECIAQINKKFGTGFSISTTKLFDQTVFHQNTETLRNRSKILYALRPEILSVYQSLMNSSWHPVSVNANKELLTSDTVLTTKEEDFFTQWRESYLNSAEELNAAKQANTWQKILTFLKFNP